MKTGVGKRASEAENISQWVAEQLINELID